jgi:hypothetical protein
MLGAWPIWTFTPVTAYFPFFNFPLQSSSFRPSPRALPRFIWAMSMAC